MKLDFRDFFYLDNDYVDNLLGHIKGYIEEEYSETDKEESSIKGGLGANLGIVKGDMDQNSITGTEVSRRGRINSEIRYNELFDYLKENGLPQIENFDEKSWDEIIEEDVYIEIRGSIHFSQFYDFERDINSVGNLGVDLGLIEEKEVKELAKQISSVIEYQEKNGIPLRIETYNSKNEFLAYLNDQYMVKDQSKIIGNDYKILCKIEKVIPRGKSQLLFDIDEIERKYSNRAERRSKNKKSLPKELKEKVAGPAAIILPIAIYR